MHAQADAAKNVSLLATCAHVIRSYSYVGQLSTEPFICRAVHIAKISVTWKLQASEMRELQFLVADRCRNER